MKIAWTNDAWDEYLQWQRDEKRRPPTLQQHIERINSLRAH